MKLWQRFAILVHQVHFSDIMPIDLSKYVHPSTMHAHEVDFNGDVLDIFVHAIGSISYKSKNTKYASNLCVPNEPKYDEKINMTKMILKTIAIIMIICISLSGSVSARQDTTKDDKIPVIIVFKDSPTKGLSQAQSVHTSSIQQVGGEIEHRFHVINGVTAKMSPQAIDALSKNKDVLYIEPDVEVYALSQSVSWGVNRVDAPSVHPFNKGAGIKVAVVDSGIDYTHPDLNDNYKGGYDFVNNDNDPMDDHGHGTKVAGIIAAEDNTFGVLGVAPEASIYGLKVLRSDGVGYSSNIIRAIEWAVDNDMDIVSMSIGSNAGSYAYQQAVNNAYNSGVLLIASAGNSGSAATDNVMYPAKYDSVIAISALDQADGICGFSSVGPAVELTAPGVYIKTTSVGGGYFNNFAGTSAAAPFVSGVAALMMASDPALTNVEIREQLRDNAIDLGESGRDIKYGYGLPIVTVSAPSLLDVQITGVGQIDSGQNTQVTMQVSSGGTPVEGATVSISSPLGHLTPETGTTDTNGNVVATYTAPQVTSQTYASISATATKTGYTEGYDTNIITVNPPQVVVQRLDATLTPASTTLETGQNTQMTIHATSEGTAVAGAEVVVSVSGGIAAPNTGTTDTNGNVIFTYTASQVTVQTGFTVSATVSKSGYETGSASGTITVNPESSTPTPNPIDVALPESPHPYPNSYDNTWTITEPGAKKMRIHFSYLETEARYDFVYIYDKNDVEIARYDRYHYAIWTPWVTGDTIKVRLATDASSIRNGFIVDMKETVNTGPPQLDVTVTQTDTILESGQNTQVTIHVSNGGTPVTGATAVVSASGGHLATATGTTNANGEFIATYTAPQVTSQTGFTISATATKTGYSMGSGSNTITVNPPQVTVSKLDVSITRADTTLVAGQTTQMTIHASSEGTPVAGALVDISASSGDLSQTMGTTDANGDFSATYTAPQVETQTYIAIMATATKSGYTEGTNANIIAINPAIVTVPKLDVTITKDSATLEAGQTTQMTIHATSEGTVVAGAEVVVSASGGNLAPDTGTTDANGDFSVTYTAPQITVQTGFTISAIATKSGYATGSASDSITVEPESSVPTPEPIDLILPESPHPYPNSYDKTWTITEPGAEKMRIHFSYLETEARYDFVYIYDKNDIEIARYDRYHYEIWTPWVTGDTIKVRLTADGSSIRNGFIVDMKESTHI